MKPIIRSVGAVLGTIRAEYRQLANRYFGNIEHFDGHAQEVCEQIVERLWDGDFYRTSLGHFNFFWMRDFGTVCESLIALGHKDRVDHTLKWAMHYYRRSNTISTCIDKAGNCFEAPSRAVDTMPWLLHCLVVSGYQINKSERHFLERQLKKYRHFYLEADGDIRQMKFSEMRDACLYDRSAYAIALVARMATCVRALSLENAFPYPPEQYQTNLIENYWNGIYFNADLETTAFSAECALFPF